MFSFQSSDRKPGTRVPLFTRDSVTRCILLGKFLNSERLMKFLHVRLAANGILYREE